MDIKEILFEKTLVPVVPSKDIAIITISASPSKVPWRRPVRITSAPRITPLIITVPGPVPYASDKVVPWNYGADVYYYGIKKETLISKNESIEVANPNIDNIVGTSKVTRSGRVFSLEISLKSISTPVRVTTTE